MSGPLDIVLTIVVLSFWILFPIGMFLSVSHVDKNTDQVVRLGHLRHYSEEEEQIHEKRPRKLKKRPIRRPDVAQVHYRRWVRH